MTRVLVTGNAPAHWASYLVNGDASGIDVDDTDNAEAFADWLFGRTWRGDPISCGDSEFFAWTHDATRLGVGGATCVEYSALVEGTIN